MAQLPTDIYIESNFNQNQRINDIAKEVNKLLPIAPNALETVDFNDVSILSELNGIMLGCKNNSTQLYNVNQGLSYVSIGTPPSVVVNDRLRTAVRLKNGNIIVSVLNSTTGASCLYTSTDNAETWQKTLTQDVAFVRALTDRSICDAMINNKSVVLYGEYNVNTSASNGNAEDKLVLWKSIDGGLSWSEVTRWNTAGVNNVRHIHCVKQFEPNGDIYIGIGDTDLQSSIWKWDGVTNWPINTSPKDLVNSSELSCVWGSQLYRAVDILSYQNKLWWITDAITGSATGPSSDSTDAVIVKVDKNLTNLEVVSHCPTKQQKAAGWLGAVSEEGKMVFVNTPDDGVVTGHKYLGVVYGNQDLSDFDLVGAYRCTDSATRCLPNGLVFIGETLFLSATNGSGKTTDGVIKCVDSGRAFRGNYSNTFIPETLHPVYWVSTRGSNTNNGFRPSTAFASVDYALQLDRVTYGGLVKLVDADTVYEGTQIVPKFNANALSGDPTEPLTIGGNGATKTKLRYGQAGAATSFFFIAANNTGLAFRNMSLEVDKLIRIVDLAGAANSVTFINSKVGDQTKPCNGITRVDSDASVKSFGSIFSPSKNVNCFTTASSTGAARHELVDSLVLGSNRFLVVNNTSSTNELKMLNTKFYGFSQQWLRVDGAATFSTLYGQGLEISSTVATAPAITGATSVTWGRGFELSYVGNPVGVSSAFGCGTVYGTAKYNYQLTNYID